MAIKELVLSAVKFAAGQTVTTLEGKSFSVGVKLDPLKFEKGEVVLAVSNKATEIVTVEGFGGYFVDNKQVIWPDYKKWKVAKMAKV